MSTVIERHALNFGSDGIAKVWLPINDASVLKADLSLAPKGPIEIPASSAMVPVIWVERLIPDHEGEQPPFVYRRFQLVKEGVVYEDLSDWTYLDTITHIQQRGGFTEVFTVHIYEEDNPRCTKCGSEIFDDVDGFCSNGDCEFHHKPQEKMSG